MKKESEVKNIEWLRKEFDDLFNGKSILTVGKSVIDGILNQLDEPEVTEEQAWDIIKEIYGISNESFVRSVLRLVMEHVKDDTTIGEIREKLESEALSQKWIDWHKEFVGKRPDGTRVEVVKEKYLQSLLVPKQELPVIPQFVADFLEGKEDWAFYEIFDDSFLYDEHDQIAKWLYDNDEHTNRERELDLALAFRQGYKVEEEQKYRVLDGNTTLLGRINGLMLTTVEILEYYPEYAPTFDLTEQEIKDYDERYIPFMVPVDEVNND